MKKLLTMLALFALSTTLVFAFGSAEQDESVDVSGVITDVDASDSEESYTLDVESADGDESWTVEMSASEFDRFNLSESAEVEMTAERTSDDRLVVSALTVDGEEFEVDSTDLLRDSDGLEVETDGSN